MGLENIFTNLHFPVDRVELRGFALVFRFMANVIVSPDLTQTAPIKDKKYPPDTLATSIFLPIYYQPVGCEQFLPLSFVAHCQYEPS